MIVKMGSREIGPGRPCFITYEAGPTHDGLATATQLVRLAAEAGADAVKFQMFDVDRLVADRSVLFSYDVLVDRALICGLICCILRADFRLEKRSGSNARLMNTVTITIAQP